MMFDARSAGFTFIWLTWSDFLLYIKIAEEALKWLQTSFG